jgi:UDP-GlcNAc3NAcA epimerase
LAREGIKDGNTRLVRNVGDVMYDSVLYYSELAEKNSALVKDLNLLTTDHSPLTSYYLATLHRAENTDDPRRLKSILKALGEIGRKMPVLLPLHPRTRKMIKVYHLFPKSGGIRLIEPVSYLTMLYLEKNARAILTDSGGVQKEAYWLKVPCFTLRKETEWVETVTSGWNVLVGSDVKTIVKEVSHLEERKRLPKKRGMFGNGRAGEKIVEILSRITPRP